MRERLQITKKEESLGVRTTNLNCTEVGLIKTKKKKDVIELITEEIKKFLGAFGKKLKDSDTTYYSTI